MQRRRDTAAAEKLMRKLLKKQGFAPDVLVTDKLRSYGAAKSKIGLSARHEQGLRKNNRAAEFASADATARAQDAALQITWISPAFPCPFTPPSKTPSTSSAISPPVARSASSERKRSTCGEPQPRRDPKQGRQNCERFKFSSRDSAVRTARSTLPTVGAACPVCRRLTTVPGVGVVVALTYRTGKHRSFPESSRTG